MYFFLLFNEEGHFDIFSLLPKPNEEFYDGTSKYFEFSSPSPIQTVEGQFAAHVVNNAYLQVTTTTKMKDWVLIMCFFP